MAVYVDDAIWEWRGRRWCHLVADSTEELHAFGARLGLKREWFQHRPARPWLDHYDLHEPARRAAVALGAQPITGREMAFHIRAKRDAFAAEAA
ncbi:MAG: DUF4031 domain-containing protein [Solirubrobacteraceae bacterium]|nr:DUF4031 domain-containing protein [Solirubrobacteraceae bacterium]